MKFAGKLTAAIIAVLLLVGSAVGVIGYKVAYDQVDEAVGIELVGCANITTGLVDPADIDKLAKGDPAVLAKVEEQLNWIADHKPIFKEAYLLSLDGKLLAVDKRMKERGYKAGDAFYLDLKDKSMIRDMKHSLYSKVYTYNGQALKTGYGPIYQGHDSNKEILALMSINFDAGIIQERTLDTVTMPFLIGAIVLVLGMAAIYIVIRKMVRPVALLSAQVRRIAEGDLQVEALTIRSKDEVGNLARDVNRMTDNLRSLIREVNETSVSVAGSSEELTASADHTGKASEHIALVTQELASGADKQLRSLEESSGIIENMSVAVRDIAASSQNVASAALETAGKATEGFDSMQTAVRQMNEIGGTMSELAETVHVLGNHSKEIGHIVEVITDIASQTNLLALNAAIEAARAGEHGRGFAVVAESVRKLAEQSSGSAAQISGLIGEILAQMDKVSGTMESATQEVSQGTELVRTAGTSFDSIRLSATDTAERIEEVSHAVNRLSEGSGLVVDSIKVLLKLADEAAQGTQSVSAAAQEQLAAMEEVSASAAYLSQMADELQSKIEAFKL